MRAIILAALSVCGIVAGGWGASLPSLPETARATSGVGGFIAYVALARLAIRAWKPGVDRLWRNDADDDTDIGSS